jgi:2-polyprenyl-3-methyl-5-hydroxy-6-metoxy-1,4-benzoquinol methylase
MAMTFNRVAYAALQVCNAVDLATVEAAAARAGLSPGARALDIGAGNAAVSVMLADRFGLQVTAVEADPGMAELAASRIAASGAPVSLVVDRSGAVLEAAAPFDLIVAIGSVEPAGRGLREPDAIIAALAGHLAPGGSLLWGDITWKAPPPDPILQMTSITNLYTDDMGWRSAAARAGLDTAFARISSDTEWDRYRATMRDAADAWLAANADHPDAPAVRRGADRVSMLLEYGRPFMDFGLYLFRKG